MLTYEEELRWKFADMAKACLTFVPENMAETVQAAKALVSVTTGEDPKLWTKIPKDECPFTIRTRLFTLVHHVLGNAQAYFVGELGSEAREVEGLKGAFDALREAAHRDLLRQHIQLGDSMAVRLGVANLSTDTAEERVRELIEQSAYPRFKRQLKRKRNLKDEFDGYDAGEHEPGESNDEPRPKRTDLGNNGKDRQV
ncbi:hypothetical protein P171DRAFT_485968 [Karstenula rhodostoma CBS 690.94]|uniref:Uncharacterized protein n=1 Tax=Karstenula rhodostoma CBS 690.94 TaxID=1392251 RepID=A0A9P4PJM5_9PLEO|nr:hypothetical protein P171DRAFT_485968 [Karstenula rhodostoma CBS 690.94]